jgi:ribosomal protein S19
MARSVWKGPFVERSLLKKVDDFRNGKVIQFRTFADEREAMEWAGVKASESAQ